MRFATLFLGPKDEERFDLHCRAEQARVLIRICKRHEKCYYNLVEPVSYPLLIVDWANIWTCTLTCTDWSPFFGLFMRDLLKLRTDMHDPYCNA